MNPVIRVSDARVFDLGFTRVLERVARKAIHAFPNRNWLANVTLWDDGGWRISMESHMGDWAEHFSIDKGEDKIHHHHYNSKIDRKLNTELHRIERKLDPMHRKSKCASKKHR